MLHGIITVPITDLRAEPKSSSERVNQALFGTPIHIARIRKDYVRVALPDDYSGWCRTGHVDQVAFAVWRKYAAGLNRIVKAESVLIKDAPTKPAYPYRLLFGTRLAVSRKGGTTKYSLPGGYTAPINERALAVIEKKRNRGVAGREIIATARRFLGVPYLWGGISPLGFDCSGLVQAVFGFHGVSLPRDSRHQRREGTAVERGELKAGDLLFFPGHVAISCGGEVIIHATARRGMVTIETLEAGMPGYREDLDTGFEGARRLLS